MFALVQWIVDKTISVVRIEDVMDSKNEGDTSFVKYDDTCFMATIIRVSEDRKYLSSIDVSTDGKIMQKQKRALSTKGVEKKKLLADTKRRQKSDASRSANLEQENLIQMRPIYNDSDSNSIGENAASSNERSRLDLNTVGIINNRETDKNDTEDGSLTNSPQSGYFDTTVAGVIDGEIEELEKLLADKLLSRQNEQQNKAVQSQPETIKKIGSKRTLEYVGIVDNEDNGVLGPASTEKHQKTAESSLHCLPQRSQRNHTRSSNRVSQTQPNSQEAESTGDDEEQAQLQGDGSTQSGNRQQRRLGRIEERRIPRPRNRTVEDEVDNLQLCRQGGAGRVLLVEHHNVWIDKAELMYCQRWVDNAPEMARRLLRLLVGNGNLIHMCACGHSKNALIRGIPSDILRSVEYYVNKKCSSRLQPSRYITIVNMMCQTLRHPKQ